MDTKGKILLVDDELDLIETMSFRLEAAGYEVVTASDGAKALEMAQKERPDLIIMDVMMPGVSGFDALQNLKKGSDTKAIPTIIFSCGKEEESWAKKAIGLGAAGYIVKPFDGESLLFTVGKFVRRKK